MRRLLWLAMSGESWVEEKDRILYISSTKAIFSSWSALTKSAPAITISSTFTFPSKLCLRSSTLAKRLRRVAAALGAAEAGGRAACCWLVEPGKAAVDGVVGDGACARVVGSQ